MLAVARAKGVYRALQVGVLGGDLPFPQGHFAGLVCAGVLTTGQVGAEALPGLLAVTRPGGVLVLTVKETLWTGSLAAAVAAAPEAAVVEATEPYISMTGATPSRAVVLRRV
jgi:hypothetical protein